MKWDNNDAQVTLGNQDNIYLFSLPIWVYSDLLRGGDEVILPCESEGIRKFLSLGIGRFLKVGSMESSEGSPSYAGKIRKDGWAGRVII